MQLNQDTSSITRQFKLKSNSFNDLADLNTGDNLNVGSETVIIESIGSITGLGDIYVVTVIVTRSATIKHNQNTPVSIVAAIGFINVFLFLIFF